MPHALGQVTTQSLLCRLGPTSWSMYCKVPFGSMTVWAMPRRVQHSRASISIVSGSYDSPSYQSAFHRSLTVLV